MMVDMIGRQESRNQKGASDICHSFRLRMLIREEKLRVE